MNKVTTRLAKLASISMLVFVMSSVAISPAHADSAHGCPYPYTCVYSEMNMQGSIVARYKVVTSDWQYLNNPVTGFSVYNTRNDDTVYTYFDVLGGWGTACAQPNGSVGSDGTLRRIRIDSSPTCR